MANSRLCSIPDCGKPHKAKGFCSAHYNRLDRHGDPNAGRTAVGDSFRFIEQHVLPYDGNDCLFWPYSKSSSGYGVVKLDGKLVITSKYICTIIHGDPASPKDETAHSCGNGHLGCVTPKHLRWATRSENNADRRIHNANSRRDRRPRLKPDQVRYIRSMKGVRTCVDLAKEFSVSAIHISHIQLRKKWAWLD